MNVFETSAKITLDTQDYEQNLDQAGQSMGQFSTKMGSGLATAAKIGIAAITAVATAAAALTKSAVSEFADYEQLVGGVETLFKDSADIVIGNAEKAYKTAGLSANEYMQTVTSFSSRLLQGLGGDTVAAAKYAHMAIVDMSDNANKMGTDISMIQNAYQGFAKQNYTMLDNLKLGYGGTATEMARLINDSGVLGDEIRVTASNINRVSFDDMIKAIHKIQEEMGITGTTTLEAEKTITGSINAMKGAWSNLLAGMANENANYETLLDEFVSSAVTAFNNIAPKINQALSSLKNIISEKFTEAFEYLYGKDGEKGHIAEIGEKIGEALEKALPKAGEVILDLLDEVTDPTNVQQSFEAMEGIAEGMADGIRHFMPLLLSNLPEIITNIVTEAVTAPGKLMENIGKIMGGIIQGVIDWASVPENWITFIEDLASGVWEIVKAVISAALSPAKMAKIIVEKILEAIKLPSFASAIEEGFKGVFDGIFNNPFKRPSFGSGSAHGGGSGYRGGGYLAADIPSYGTFGGGGYSTLRASPAMSNNISININGAKYQDENQLAQAVATQLQLELDRREAII